MGVNSCFYCKRETTRTSQIHQHHIFGRINSDMVVPTCIACHEEITLNQQKNMPRIAREHKASPLQRLLYSEASLGVHLQILGKEHTRIAKQLLKEVEHDNSIHKMLPQPEKREETKELEAKEDQKE